MFTLIVNFTMKILTDTLLIRFVIDGTSQLFSQHGRAGCELSILGVQGKRVG